MNGPAPQPQDESALEREVQRRVGRQTKALSDEIQSLRDTVASCRDDLIRQNAVIRQMTEMPLAFGTLLRTQDQVDPARYQVDDEVLVTDATSPHYLRGGNVVSGRGVSPSVDAEGFVYVKLTNGVEAKFGVGVAGKAPQQVRLTSKSDGTSALISVDGKPWEVKGLPDPSLRPGDTVKVFPESKAIVGRGEPVEAGPICHVVAVLDEGVEVMVGGDKRLVLLPRDTAVAEGDRVVCDPGLLGVVRKLPPDARQRYNVSADLNVTWDDIGGLEVAKQELRDAIELPFAHPDLYQFYGVEPLRGLLLYGPPGCGKTLMARAAAASVARTHGKAAAGSAYIYVKSPEILDKWVGNTEREIRDLFERGRRHYREHGYKAILAFDEADAIMPQRGTRLTSSISDTVVPMFLGEMDGIDSKQTVENPVVVLLTNRPDVLDPAVTRPGRISRHIKVDRPDQMSAIDILNLHTRPVPFQDERNRMAVLAITASDLFGKTRLLYRVNNEHDFTLGDCVNGAMLANVAEMAKMHALHRDLSAKSRTGLTTDDLRAAVQKTYTQQQGLNHSYDVADFCEKKGIQPAQAKVERCFGAA